jgi:hypothetical protein
MYYFKGKAQVQLPNDESPNRSSITCRNFKKLHLNLKRILCGQIYRRRNQGID